MENENQITVDANDEINERVGGDQATAHNSDSESEKVTDNNDKSDVVDVIGNGQLVKKVSSPAQVNAVDVLFAFNRIDW